MNQEEKIAFNALLQKQCHEMMNSFLKSELGPIDSAFVLGLCGNMIVELLTQIKKEPKEEIRENVFLAIEKGFYECTSQVILIKGDD